MLGLYSGAIGRMPSHLHQPSLCHALSSTPMGSSEFPHILSQEGQRGHICVYHRVRLITASCWTLLGPEHHIPFRISYCRKPQTLSHEPGQSQLWSRRKRNSAESLTGFPTNQARPGTGTAVIRSSRGGIVVSFWGFDMKPRERNTRIFANLRKWYQSIEWSFSGVQVHTYHLGILLACKFWVRRSEMGPESFHF